MTDQPTHPVRQPRGMHRQLLPTADRIAQQVNKAYGFPARAHQPTPPTAAQVVAAATARARAQQQKAYNPSEPRAPAGSPAGGQWGPGGYTPPAAPGVARPGVRKPVKPKTPKAPKPKKPKIPKPKKPKKPKKPRVHHPRVRKPRKPYVHHPRVRHPKKPRVRHLRAHKPRKPRVRHPRTRRAVAKA